MMHKRRILSNLITIFSAGILVCGCFKLPPPKPRREAKRLRPPEYACLKVSGKMQIDGALNEPDWQRAAKAAINVRHNANGQKASQPVGYFRTLYSEEALYVALEVLDHDVRASGEKRDDTDVTPPNDVAMLFIDINGDDEHFFEFRLNPLNSFTDMLVIRPDSESPLNERLTYGLMFVKGYDLTEYATQAKIHGTANESGDTDKGWTAELMIPYKWLTMPLKRPVPTGGDSWRIQIALQTGTEAEHRYHVWAPSYNAWHHHCIDHWGKVVFR